MDHVAIMKKSWHLLPKILSGEKTIESRWYQTRRKPWNAIKKGETIYFKNSGEPISAKAIVSEVMQFEITDIADAEKITKKYGKQICMIYKDPKTWKSLPRYCVLMYLEKPKLVTPFHINKTGFGSAAAWLTVKDIKQIKIDII